MEGDLPHQHEQGNDTQLDQGSDFEGFRGKGGARRRKTVDGGNPDKTGDHHGHGDGHTTYQQHKKTDQPGEADPFRRHEHAYSVW